MTTDIDAVPCARRRSIPVPERPRATPTWASSTEPHEDSWSLLEAATTESTWWAWHDGTQGASAVAGGTVWTSGAAAAPGDAVHARVLERWPEGARDLPATVGGWAFARRGSDPAWAAFGDEALWVPRWVAGSLDGRCRLVRAPDARPRPAAPRPGAAVALKWHSTPSRGGYEALVDSGLEAISRGDLGKIVLARRLQARLAEGRFDPAATLRALRHAHPSAIVFGVGRGDVAFVGASPETLVRRRGDRLESEAVAGTVAAGIDPRALEGRDKDGREHDHVVRHIVNTLSEIAGDVRVEPRRVCDAGSVQHLVTPVSATARSSVLDVARRLHPTPALAGTPPRRAATWLRELEPFERGWYGAPVGWLAPNGEGHLAVAIRSALLTGSHAVAYVGAGIVEGSVPADEWVETEHKLQSVLPHLRAEAP